MRRKLLIVLAALAAAVALAIIGPGVYWRLVGRARGEAFYDGRPTSYWARQIETHADVEHVDYSRGELISWPSPYAWLPRPLLERLMGRVLVLKAFKPLSAAMSAQMAA